MQNTKYQYIYKKIFPVPFISAHFISLLSSILPFMLLKLFPLHICPLMTVPEGHGVYQSNYNLSLGPPFSTPISSFGNLQIQPTNSSKTLVPIYQTTPCHSPETHNFIGGNIFHIPHTWENVDGTGEEYSQRMKFFS